MPSRVIRQGFLDSEKINSLSEEEQNFFIRLMLIVDDYGRFDARPEMLKSHCYPVTDKCLSNVRQMTDKIASIELIVVYEFNGKKYLQINNFDQRLRQKHQKYPPPPCQQYDSNVSATCPPEITLDSDSESEIISKRKEIETERKGIIRGRETISPKKAAINLKIKNGIHLTQEEANYKGE